MNIIRNRGFDFQSSVEKVLQSLISETNAVDKGNGQYKGTCPLCETKEHLYLKLFNNEFGNKKIVMFCQKCKADFPLICKALNIKQVDCFENKNRGQPNQWEFMREHIYTDEYNNPVAKKMIYKTSSGKKGVWNKYSNGTYVKGLNGYKPPLYDVVNVIKEQDTIYIAEGEKDAETLKKMGYTATTSPNGAGSKWNKSHNKYIKGKNIIIIKDNDEAGAKYAEDIAKNIIDDVKSVKIINPLDILPTLQNKGDISDIANKLGTEETKKKLIDVVTNTKNIQISSNNSSEIQEKKEWLLPKCDNYGEIKGYFIDEIKFVEYFKNKNKIVFVNNNFYDESGQIKKGFIKRQIQEEIEQHFTSGITTKVDNLYKALINKCFINLPEPKRNIIYCKNTTIQINDDNTFSEIDNDDFTFNRLNINYDKNDNDITEWNKFLNSLLNKEDIPTLQEYLGYCLIPVTDGQKALFLIGKGGEGKSRIGVLLQEIFKNSFISDEIQNIEDDKFLLAKLENKLVFYDDDLQAKKMTSTGKFKRLVTNELTLQAEAKGQDKYDLKPYTRFFACGNEALGSCFDKSDGWYRRLIILTCKPQTRTLQETLQTSEINERLSKEKNAIFNWCLQGLQRLLNNKFKFTISNIAQKTLDALQNDENSIIPFMRDDRYIKTGILNSKISTKDLLDLYKIWCNENGLTPLADRTFTTYLKENQDKFNIIYKEQIIIKDKRIRGYEGISITEDAKHILINDNFYNPYGLLKKA